jgi:hypothetical protein
VAETCCTSVKTDVQKVALKTIIIECKEHKAIIDIENILIFAYRISVGGI